jgi:hypothetical protein
MALVLYRTLLDPFKMALVLYRTPLDHLCDNEDADFLCTQLLGTRQVWLATPLPRALWTIVHSFLESRRVCLIVYARCYNILLCGGCEEDGFGGGCAGLWFAT